MKNGRTTTTGPLAHERPVLVDHGKFKLKGFAFGQEEKGGELWYTVTIVKSEYETHNMTCVGPCINKQYPSSKVEFVERDTSKKMIEIENQREEKEPKKEKESKVIRKGRAPKEEKVVKSVKKKKPVKKEKSIKKKKPMKEWVIQKGKIKKLKREVK